MPTIASTRACRAASRFLIAMGIWAACAPMLAAQAPSARVAEPGTIGFRVGGVFSSYGGRFGHPFSPADGTRVPLANEVFAGRIADPSFEPFETLRGRLNVFFDSIPGEPFQVPAGGLALTTSRLEAQADHREVPFELELGLLPRISVGVRVPLVQHTLVVSGFEAGEGNVGRNPDPAGNRALLIGVDSAFAELGGSPLLPTRDSPAGVALRQRVAEATQGGELLLPADPLARLGAAGVPGLDGIPLGRFDPALPGWELGDTEVQLSLQLARPYAGVAGGTSLGAALDVGVRIPTGTAPDAAYLVHPRPSIGVGGVTAGLRADLQTRRFGAAAALRMQRLRGLTLPQQLWPEPGDEGSLVGPPQSVELLWEPGTRVSVEVHPYVRLVNEIRLLGSYGFERRSERYSARIPVGDTGTVEEVLGEGPAVVQRWGAGIEYSTLRRYQAGEADLPFEAAVLFRNALAGRGGAPDDRTVMVQLRLFLRLWGRG